VAEGGEGTLLPVFSQERRSLLSKRRKGEGGSSRRRTEGKTCAGKWGWRRAGKERKGRGEATPLSESSRGGGPWTSNSERRAPHKKGRGKRHRKKEPSTPRSALVLPMREVKSILCEFNNDGKGKGGEKGGKSARLLAAKPLDVLKFH